MIGLAEGSAASGSGIIDDYWIRDEGSANEHYETDEFFNDRHNTGTLPYNAVKVLDVLGAKYDPDQNWNLSVQRILLPDKFSGDDSIEIAKIFNEKMPPTNKGNAVYLTTEWPEDGKTVGHATTMIRHPLETEWEWYNSSNQSINSQPGLLKDMTKGVFRQWTKSCGPWALFHILRTLEGKKGPEEIYLKEMVPIDENTYQWKLESDKARIKNDRLLLKYLSRALPSNARDEIVKLMEALNVENEEVHAGRPLVDTPRFRKMWGKLKEKQIEKIIHDSKIASPNYDFFKPSSLNTTTMKKGAGITRYYCHPRLGSRGIWEDIESKCQSPPRGIKPVLVMEGDDHSFSLEDMIRFYKNELIALDYLCEK